MYKSAHQVYPKKVSPHVITGINLLRQLFPEITDVTIKPLDTLGYSGAQFSRLTLLEKEHPISLILKELDLKTDWFSIRTKDTWGREACVLSSPVLQPVYEIFDLPYLFVAAEQSSVKLLMQDVAEGLFPDETRPISQAAQDLMLDRLAQLHARFWNSSELAPLQWLQRPDDFLYIMGPLDHSIADDKTTEQYSSQDLRLSIQRGWEEAGRLLPKEIRDLLWSRPSENAKYWHNLPHTLVHGDTKVANFAQMSGQHLCLLDWAFTGTAPATCDIGWFLAVNAKRLHDTKEVVLSKYRMKLEDHLGFHIDDALWRKLENVGILFGAAMLLWSKALAYANGKDGAEEEWKWWVERLGFVCTF